MRNRIIEAVFDGWCEGEFGMKTEEGPETDNAIDNIAKYFNASGKAKLYIESEIRCALCTREETAFEDGFYLCLELLNGNIFSRPKLIKGND